MIRIGIFLFEIFGKLMGKLPKRGIYVLSDFLFFIGFYVIRYRRKVVFENLRNTFPDKSEKEIKGISRRFFQHLSDVMIENVASLYMKPGKIKNNWLIKLNYTKTSIETKGKQTQTFSDGRKISDITSEIYMDSAEFTFTIIHLF